MKKQELLKVIKAYEDEYKEVMFKAMDAAARSTNEEKIAELEKIQNEATIKYETILNLLNSIEVFEAIKRKAENVWRAGMITISEVDYIVNKELNEEVEKEGAALDKLLGSELDFNCKVQDWYHEEYPTDHMYEYIDNEITFGDVFSAFQEGKEFYRTIGVGDSVIRERIFSGLVDVLNNYSNDGSYEYEDIYLAWLHRLPIVNKGGIKNEI